jgi:hypothetical protein
LAHLKEMYRTMKYCVGTPNRGLFLKPTMKWDTKDPNFEFEIKGRSDSDFTKDPERHRSVSGYSTFFVARRSQPKVVCKEVWNSTWRQQNSWAGLNVRKKCYSICAY